MYLNQARLSALVCLGAVTLLLGGCKDDSQSPAVRSQPPLGEIPSGSTLAPVDLVYVCGNKFLATNSTNGPVQVEYRVGGTDETGSLTLRHRVDEDPGYGETELETKGRGVVELYQNDQLVARRRNRGLACGAAPAASVAGIGASASAGEWGAPFSTVIVAIHAAMLPTGKVLLWGEFGTPQVWDPATGSFTAVPSPQWVFCTGLSFLADGRLLVVGGHHGLNHGLPNMSIFAPGTESWSISPPMPRGRWYPSSTTLSNGDVLLLGGRDEVGVPVQQPEVWSEGVFRTLSNASRLLPFYPRAFLAPNGKVFYAGVGRPSRYLSTSGGGAWTTVSTMLYGLRDYGAAVMYDEGKVLYAGGGLTTNTAETIDLNAAAPAWKWTGSMAFPRRHLNLTMLPTGEVLATGGSNGTTFNNFNAAVHAAELWSPTTGTWTTLASNTVNRAYHATAVLLPDGRVLNAGSGDAGGQVGQSTAELFSPPYLFKGPQPTITDAPSLVGYGTTFTVSSPQAADIAKVSLIRLSSVTHGADMNQRFQWLSFTHQDGGVSITAPTSRNITPPGHYLLFILDGNGVPSVARIVKVGSGSEPPPPNTPPTAEFTSSCIGLACGFTDGSKDDGSVVGWAWDFGDNSGSSAVRSPSYAYGAEGSYEVTLTATDNTGMTGTSKHTVTVAPVPPPPPPPPIALTVTGRTDATKQYMQLKWTGATGATVDVYRNGRLLLNTPNDGLYTNSRNFLGAATYTYKVCQVGTSTCSNEASVTFK